MVHCQTKCFRFFFFLPKNVTQNVIPRQKILGKANTNKKFTARLLGYFNILKYMSVKEWILSNCGAGKDS